MNNEITFDLSVVDNSIITTDTTVKFEDIVVDVMVFVRWLDFIRIKYNVRDLHDLHSHEELSIITSQWPVAREIEIRLGAQKQLTDLVDDEMTSRIKAAKTYIDYTNESGTIVLTIEKMFQVCARLFTDFKLGKKDFVTVVSYVWESQVIENQSIQQLIAFLQDIYESRNKKMVMEGNVTTYFEITWSLLVRRYGKETLPPYMNKYWLQMQESCDMFEVPEYMNSTRSIEILVAALVDSDTKKVEIDVYSKSYGRVDVDLNTSILHEYDRQISKQSCVPPETESMVKTLVVMKVVPESSRDELVEYFCSTLTETDAKLKNGSLDLDCSVLNVGWLTVPKNPKNEIETSQRTFANMLLSKLKDEEHFYLFCPITYDYIRIKHPSGIKVPNSQFLGSMLRTLMKFFHFMNHVCSFFNKDRDKTKKLVLNTIEHLAKNFSPQVEYRQRYSLLFTMNYKVWVRAVEITEFGMIRDVYLPSPTMGYGQVYDELLGDIIIEI